jgi:hypothetical protein
LSSLSIALFLPGAPAPRTLPLFPALRRQRLSWRFRHVTSALALRAHPGGVPTRVLRVCRGRLVPAWSCSCATSTICTLQTSPGHMHARMHACLHACTDISKTQRAAHAASGPAAAYARTGRLARWRSGRGRLRGTPVGKADHAETPDAEHTCTYLLRAVTGSARADRGTRSPPGPSLP